MNGKRPVGGGWRLSSSKQHSDGTVVTTWRKSVGHEDWAVVSGVDTTTGQPAYRVMAVVDPRRGLQALRKPSDAEARQILEDFQMLDAFEQEERNDPARGFVKWVHSEARA